MTAMGLFGTLFDRWFNPIKVTKGSSKTGGVIDIMRRLRRGNCVLLFCEGRLSHNGRSTYIAPATAKLAKSVRCKVVTFRASGGFFIEPRWQNYLNRGKLFSAGVVHEYGAEELSKMTNDEVLEHIRADLYVDAYEEQERRMQRFKFKHGVRDVIRYYDTCPRCGGLDTLTATEERVKCSCGWELTMDEYGFFHEPDGKNTHRPRLGKAPACQLPRALRARRGRRGAGCEDLRNRRGLRAHLSRLRRAHRLPPPG